MCFVTAVSLHATLLGSAADAVLVRPVDDPLQVVRVTFAGQVEAVEKDSATYVRGRELFTERFPNAEVLFTLGDFSMYSMPLSHGRFVEGFARAADVIAADLSL